VASTELTGVEYKADKDLEAAKYAADAETARLATKLAFATDKFTILLPIIQSIIKSLT
jgi:hypothetical protein